MGSDKGECPAVVTCELDRALFSAAISWVFGRGGMDSAEGFSEPNILELADSRLDSPGVNTTDRGEREVAVGRGLGGTKGKLARTESVFDRNDCTDSGL